MGLTVTLKHSLRDMAPPQNNGEIFGRGFDGEGRPDERQAVPIPAYLCAALGNEMAAAHGGIREGFAERRGNGLPRPGERSDERDLADCGPHGFVLRFRYPVQVVPVTGVIGLRRPGSGATAGHDVVDLLG